MKISYLIGLQIVTGVFVGFASHNVLYGLATMTALEFFIELGNSFLK